MSFFQEFTISFGREKDRQIKELETKAQADATTHEAALGVKDVRIAELEAHLAPFREYIVAHPVPVPVPVDQTPEARAGQDGGGEAGQTQVEVDNRPRDESGRFVAADDDPALIPA